MTLPRGGCRGPDLRRYEQILGLVREVWPAARINVEELDTRPPMILLDVDPIHTVVVEYWPRPGWQWTVYVADTGALPTSAAPVFHRAVAPPGAPAAEVANAFLAVAAAVAAGDLPRPPGPLRRAAHTLRRLAGAGR